VTGIAGVAGPPTVYFPTVYLLHATMSIAVDPARVSAVRRHYYKGRISTDVEVACLENLRFLQHDNIETLPVSF
jgi:hypothetical protein